MNSATTVNPTDVYAPPSHSYPPLQRAPPNPSSPSYYSQYATPLVDRNYSEQGAPSDEHTGYLTHAVSSLPPESKYSDDAMYISKAKEMALKTQQMLSKFSGANKPSDKISVTNLPRNDALQSETMDGRTERNQMTVENVNQLLYGNNFTNIHPNLGTSRSYDNRGTTTAGGYDNLSQVSTRQFLAEAEVEPVYTRDDLLARRNELTHDLALKASQTKSQRALVEPKPVAPAAQVENPNYDPTIENILKSIGFNFEFSHMKQAEAKERERIANIAAAEEARRLAIEDARRAADDDARRMAAEEVRRAAIENVRRAAAEDARRVAADNLKCAEAENAWQVSVEAARLAAADEATYLASTRLLSDRMTNPGKYRRTPDLGTPASPDRRETSRSPGVNFQVEAGGKKLYEDFSDSDNDFNDRTSLKQSKKMRTDFRADKRAVYGESDRTGTRHRSSRDRSREKLSDWEGEIIDGKKSVERISRKTSRHVEPTSSMRRARKEVGARKGSSNSSQQRRSEDSSSSDRSPRRFDSSGKSKRNTSAEKTRTKSNYKTNEKESHRNRSEEKKRDRHADENAQGTGKHKLRTDGQPLKKKPVVIVIDDDQQEETKQIKELQQELTIFENRSFALTKKLRVCTKDDPISVEKDKRLLALNIDRQRNIKQQIELLVCARILNFI